MTRYDLTRIAQIYGATEQEVREAEHHAVLAPLVPLSSLLEPLVRQAAMLAAARAQGRIMAGDER